MQEDILPAYVSLADGGDDDVDDGGRREDKNSRYVEQEPEQKETFDNFR